MSKQSLYHFLISNFVIFGIFLFGVGCIQLNEQEQIQEGNFEIHVFDLMNLNTLGADTSKSIRQNDISVIDDNILEQSDLVIKEDDILHYDWATQTITLSDEFREKYIADDSILSNLSLFIVIFQEQPVMSGTILFWFSPLRLDTPVLHIEYPSEGDVGLRIGLKPEGYDYNLAQKEKGVLMGDQKITEQIRHHFQELGKLSD